MMRHVTADQELRKKVARRIMAFGGHEWDGALGLLADEIITEVRAAPRAGSGEAPRGDPRTDDEAFHLWLEGQDGKEDFPACDENTIDAMLLAWRAALRAGSGGPPPNENTGRETEWSRSIAPLAEWQAMEKLCYEHWESIGGAQSPEVLAETLMEIGLSAARPSGPPPEPSETWMDVERIWCQALLPEGAEVIQRVTERALAARPPAGAPTEDARLAARLLLELGYATEPRHPGLRDMDVREIATRPPSEFKGQTRTLTDAEVAAILAEYRAAAPTAEEKPE